MTEDGQVAWWLDVLEQTMAECETDELRCDKGQVYVLPCGKRTYTWCVKSGLFYTTLQVEGAEGELANTIWHQGDIIHSLDDDIMIPAHAMVDGVLVRSLSPEFNKAVEADQRTAMALAEYYHRQFTSTLDHYRQATLLPSRERLEYFERLFEEMPELEGEKIDDRTLSLFMGVHRASVSRLRRELHRQDK